MVHGQQTNIKEQMTKGHGHWFLYTADLKKIILKMKNGRKKV